MGTGITDERPHLAAYRPVHDQIDQSVLTGFLSSRDAGDSIDDRAAMILVWHSIPQCGPVRSGPRQDYEVSVIGVSSIPLVTLADGVNDRLRVKRTRSVCA